MIRLLRAVGRRRNWMSAAGPARTLAAKSIPSIFALDATWVRAPLESDVNNSDLARTCVALSSDLPPVTTGDVVRVDGDVRAVQ